MSDNVYKTIVNFMVLIWNLAMVAGTTWLVTTEGWSMWAYMLCICLMATRRREAE